MLRTSPEQFEELARRGRHVPVLREILADLDTPLSLFRKLDDGRTAFLLESVEGGEKWARYSFLGVGARATFSARGSRVEWSEAGRTESLTAEGDPLEILRERLRAFAAAKPEGFELPRFLGGAVGMIAYDWVRFVEQIPDSNPDRIGLPDAFFVLPEYVVVYDNVRHTALIAIHAEVEPGDDVRAAFRRRRRADRGDGRATADAPRCGAAATGGARAHGGRAESLRVGLPRDREAREGVHRGGRHLPGRARRSSSSFRCRSIRSRSTAICG